MTMSDEEYEKCYEIRDRFLEEVREAFRKAKSELSEEQLDYIVYNMQDGLSLFSSWMNN